eukprot:7418444-Prorocentrum_lima.AAC.1
MKTPQGVVITPDGLHAGIYPPEVLALYNAQRAQTASRLAVKDAKHPRPTFREGDQVLFYKESGLGKVGTWHGPATILKFNTTGRTVLVKHNDTGKIHRCSPHRMKLYFPTVSDVAEEEELLADSPVQLPGIPALPSEWLFGTPTGECESHTHCDTQVTLDDCRQSLQAWPPAAEGHIGKTGDQQPITSSSVNIAQPLAAPSKRSL